MINVKNLAAHLDLANHRSTATKKDITTLSKLVLKHGFNAAFVNPCWIRLAKTLVKKKAKVGTVISFPLGQETTEMKLASVTEAIGKGADELDVSSNIGWLKNGQDKIYLKEMKRIVQRAKKKKADIIVKFIIETGYLTEEEIKRASLLVLKSGADFIKTCSGFGKRGARLEDVEIIKKAVGNKIKIKVAGGIKTRKQAEDFIKTGASQIGTSKAVEIVSEK